MTFQAYIDNIKAKTGKSPADFHKGAKARGLIEPGSKVGPIVAWLKAEEGLGHGHAMAIVQAFKNEGWYPIDGDAPAKAGVKKIPAKKAKA
ncbi:DUF4287 domain-containing protein [Variovorax sp. J22R133]|uniref:DUF4287 domain-containing protein n=1 Tax=Variovorax brevis TaxID=3053503 RepID=UPI002575C436|nr:DUF4287 domain-containing protein [Variovorax sp. J22R133]MDM0115942.1 DUF4287 domain-containing protein [Variovorax sp. J22R133]